MIEIKEINLQLILEIQGINSRMRIYRLQKINVWGKILLVLAKFPSPSHDKRVQDLQFLPVSFSPTFAGRITLPKPKPNKQTKRKESN